MATVTQSARPFENDRVTLDMVEEIARTTGLTDRQKQTIERHAQTLIQRTLDEPARLWDTWSQLCELAFTAGLEVLHPRRDQIAASFAMKEEQVRRGVDLAARMEQLLGHPLDGADQLPTASEELRRFRTEVLDRWRSFDDLAEMLIEKIHLPAERLGEIAKHNPPPQSWYEEDFDPFTPDAPK
jgi:hypothetical protein